MGAGSSKKGACLGAGLAPGGGAGLAPGGGVGLAPGRGARTRSCTEWSNGPCTGPCTEPCTGLCTQMCSRAAWRAPGHAPGSRGCVCSAAQRALGRALCVVCSACSSCKGCRPLGTVQRGWSGVECRGACRGVRVQTAGQPYVGCAVGCAAGHNRQQRVVQRDVDFFKRLVPGPRRLKCICSEGAGAHL